MEGSPGFGVGKLEGVFSLPDSDHLSRRLVTGAGVGLQDNGRLLVGNLPTCYTAFHLDVPIAYFKSSIGVVLLFGGGDEGETYHLQVRSLRGR